MGSRHFESLIFQSPLHSHTKSNIFYSLFINTMKWKQLGCCVLPLQTCSLAWASHLFFSLWHFYFCFLLHQLWRKQLQNCLTEWCSALINTSPMLMPVQKKVDCSVRYFLFIYVVSHFTICSCCVCFNCCDFILMFILLLSSINTEIFTCHVLLFGTLCFKEHTHTYQKK